MPHIRLYRKAIDVTQSGDPYDRYELDSHVRASVCGIRILAFLALWRLGVA